MVLMPFRKRNVILMVWIRSEVPFSKDAKSCCSTGIVTQLLQSSAPTLQLLMDWQVLDG